MFDFWDMWAAIVLLALIGGCTMTIDSLGDDSVKRKEIEMRYSWNKCK